MALDLASDFDILYADFGVEAVYTPQGGVAADPALVIFDQPGTEIVGGSIIATDYSVRFPASQYPDVRRGDLFAISGKNYKAREHAQPIGDGAEHAVPLEQA